MQSAYDPASIEPKWQERWEEQGVYRADDDSSRPKKYVLDMFPYPSGDGLHLGHVEIYTISDVFARVSRHQGFNVLHPMGWDAFGLPAERYAVRNEIHPREAVEINVANFRRQLKRLGCSYDWAREINTTDPAYYKWTQWIFRKLHERGLAYEAEVPVNWCEALGTVLANEEVIDGRSEQGGHPVERRPMRQWLLKITEYAERLLSDLDTLDWPESLKQMQRKWIGRSEGADITFRIDGHDDSFVVFTTRPDTLFGATFCVLAPEHPLVEKITTDAQRADVQDYVTRTSRRSERDRLAETKEKSGVFTGATTTNPATGTSIPVFIADYVLMGYGTGAIMAVPRPKTSATWDFATGVRPTDHSNGRTSQRLRRRGVRRRGAGNQQRLPGRPAGRGRQAEDDRVAGRRRPGRRPRHLPAAGLAVLAAAVLGRAVPGDSPRRRRDRPPGRRRAARHPARRRQLQAHRHGGESAGRDRRLGQHDRRGRHTGHGRETNTMPQWAGSCWYYLRYIDPRNDAAFSRSREGEAVDARRRLCRRCRACRAASPVRALLAQGALRLRPGVHIRAVPTPDQPGHDPGAGVSQRERQLREARRGRRRQRHVPPHALGRDGGAPSSRR